MFRGIMRAPSALRARCETLRNSLRSEKLGSGIDLGLKELSEQLIESMFIGVS